LGIIPGLNNINIITKNRYTSRTLRFFFDKAYAVTEVMDILINVPTIVIITEFSVLRASTLVVKINLYASMLKALKPPISPDIEKEPTTT